jgi:hypothetical protein
VAFEIRMVGRNRIRRGEAREELWNEIDEHGQGWTTIWEHSPGPTSLDHRTVMSSATVSDLTFDGTSITESVTR